MSTGDLKDPVALLVVRLPTWLKDRLYAEAQRRRGGPSRLVAAALEHFLLLDSEQTFSVMDRTEDERGEEESESCAE